MEAKRRVSLSPPCRDDGGEHSIRPPGRVALPGPGALDVALAAAQTRVASTSRTSVPAVRRTVRFL
jgi:hypothetical protein